MNETTKIRIENFRKRWIPGLILPAAFFAAVLGLLWTPMDGLAGLTDTLASILPGVLGERAGSFDRQIGQALVYGIDINKRVTNMTFWGFFYLPLLFALCWGALSLLFRGREIEKESLSFLNRLTACAFPMAVLSLLARLDASFLTAFSPIAVLAILGVLLYLRFGAGLVPLKTFKWVFFTSFVLEYFAIRFFLAISEAWYECVAVTAYPLVLVGLYILAVGFAKSQHCDSLCAAATPLYAAPVLVSLFLELTNIFNQYGVFFYHKTAVVMVIMLGSVLLGAAWCFLRGGKVKPGAADYTRWQYPLLVLGFTMLMIQPARQIVAGTELFESSNAGSDVYALLTAGEIPLVENLNVHMILEEVGSILYGWLNRDPLGAIWYCYPLVGIAEYLVMYWFFSVLTNRENGLLMTLLFPIRGIQWLIHPGLGILYGLFPMLAGVEAARRKDRRSIFLFVMSCVLLCLYRADAGLSSGIAAVLVLTVWFLLRRERKPLCMLWVTGLCMGALAAGLFVLLCVLRGISPLARILEAVSLLWAFVLWAYRTVAPGFDFTFFLTYFFVPIGTVFIVTRVFLYWKKKQVPDLLFLMDLMVAASYLLNFSRGIVRHSLMENDYAFAMGFGVLSIVISLWILAGQKAIQLPLFLCCFLVLRVFMAGGVPENGTLLQDSIDRQKQMEPYENVAETVDRVVIPDELKAIYTPLKMIFDATLTPGQTYFDYSHQTTLYALTNRNKPVYTNQSPSELNAEFDHLMFVREIEEMDCPYALSLVGGSGFDGIDLDMNHYIVSEYLYQNYHPLCQIGNYCLWARAEEYDRRADEVRALIASGAVEATMLQGGEDFMIRVYEMGQIPWLWGTYDSAEPQEVLQTLHSASSVEREIIEVYSTDTPGRFLYEAKSKWLADHGENVRVAVWCSSVGDQDDIVWYALEQDGDVFTTAVDISEHLGQTGDYQFHIYYDDEDGQAQIYQSLTRTVTADGMLVGGDAQSYDYELRSGELDRSDGNYLQIQARTERAGRASAELLNEDGETVCTMTFDLQPGQNTYMIRVSMNYMWNAGQVAHLRLDTDEKVEDLTVRVLRGDINYNGMNFLQRWVLEAEPTLNAEAKRTEA